MHCRFQKKNADSPQNVNPEDVRKAFAALASNKFVRHSDSLVASRKDHDSKDCPSLVLDSDPFAIPPRISIGSFRRCFILIFEALSRFSDPEVYEPPAAKRAKNSTENLTMFPDSKVLWRVNVPRFDRYFCDRLIVSMVARRIDSVIST